MAREERIAREAIAKFHLDLKGMTVLTEAATGAYAWTAVMAAMAGADKVWAMTRDSRHGLACEVKTVTDVLCEEVGVDGVQVVDATFERAISEADIVTNLGFVRPINDSFARRMKKGAVVSLMCEPWEVREEDVDIDALRRHDIPVMGTNETVPELDTFGYIGHLAVKLAMEMEIEVNRCRVMFVGDGYHGQKGEEAFLALGADVLDDDRVGTSVDVIVVVEPNSRRPLLAPIALARLEPSVSVVHIIGNIDKAGLAEEGIRVNPPEETPLGHMAVALDYLGPRPVIELHAAGLKVGQELARGYKMKGTVMEASHFALKRSPALQVRTGR